MRKRTKWLLATTGLVAAFGLWHFQPWSSIGPIGYWRVQLGMTEDEIATVIGEQSKDYRRSRHVGGRTSPGMVEELLLQQGLAYEDLPRRYGDKARTGQAVTIRQWWGDVYAIDVAFDAEGKAVGLYLMNLRRVNW